MNNDLEVVEVGNWFTEYRCRKCEERFVVDDEDAVFFTHECKTDDAK